VDAVIGSAAPLTLTTSSSPRYLLLCDGSELTAPQPRWWWHLASSITLWWAPCFPLCALAIKPVTYWYRFSGGGTTSILSWYSVEVCLVYYPAFVSKWVVTVGKLLILAPAKFWCKPIKLSLLPQFSVGSLVDPNSCFVFWSLCLSLSLFESFPLVIDFLIRVILI
jgi:hypothetical protein